MSVEAWMDLTGEEVLQELRAMGLPAFRGKQFAAWLAQGADWDGMTNLPKTLREELAGKRPLGGVKIVETLISRKDDTRKYLFETEDGNIIEGVLMTYKHGRTLCLSTQAGCRMGCAFCASTLKGLARNLTSGEMLGEVLAVNRTLGEKRGIHNLVLMGSGEPFDNYDHVVSFLRRVNDPEGIGISLRNISLSTCGLVPQMERFASEGLPVTLCLSLHAPNDELRKQIMPAARAYALADVMQAMKGYLAATGRRLIFEYALIRDFNDTRECALELANLVRGMQAHINLIPLNQVSETGLAGSTDEAVEAFQETLRRRGISVTKRMEMGADIQGACGQLRLGYMENKEKQ